MLTIDIAARVTARSMWVFDVAYLHQERTAWRNGALQSIAINHRESLNGDIRRQQWDLFARGPEGLMAHRTQGTNLPDFRQRHPSFVRLWPLSTFGQPWTEAYASTRPEPRPDLGLPAAAMAPRLRTPLAFIFYWARWMPSNGDNVPVFLATFKKDARADIPIGPATAGADGLSTRRVTLRHPLLRDAPPSIADAWFSADHRLVRLTFDLHGVEGDVQGTLRQDACSGPAPPAPE